MKVGVLGSGIVGRVLATAFLKERHSVMLGTRDTAKTEVVKWQEENPEGNTGTFSAVAGFAEIIVLAVAGLAATEALELAGAANLEGKTIIDATNPIAAAPPVDGVLQYFTGPNESLMEKLQASYPKANFVKAFNSMGNPVFYQPDYKGVLPSMCICGNSDAAKQQISEIVKAFGWEAVDFGKATAARAIEPLAMLWCIRGFNNNQWNHAFTLLQHA